MSYESYKEYRLAPDDNGCWDVLDKEYQQYATYPSKAAAKRAIDKLVAAQPNQYEDTGLRQHILHIMHSHGAAKEAVEAMLQLIESEATRREQALLDELEGLDRNEYSLRDFIAARRAKNI